MLSLCSRTVSRHLYRQFHVSAMAPVAVGDKVPSVTLFEDSPGGKVELGSLCAGKKVVMFGVPGAFTPGCSKTHLPGYVAAADDLKTKGVDEIVCVSVNDPFVMEAWGKEQSAGGKVRMLADTTADLTKALGLELDLTAVLGNVR